MPPEKPQLKAVIYDRVSKDKHRDARSVREQKADNITHCDRYGWTVEEVFADNDLSASRFARKARPEWERLVEALADRSRGLEVLVLWEPSRGDRELEMWARLLNTCRREGVLIHITSHDRTYDVRKPRDWRSLAEDGVDSAYESEKVSERIRRGTRSRAAEGRPHGPVIYGYDRVYDPANGQLVGQVINAEQAAVIREMASRVLRGFPLEAIASIINGQGMAAPKGGRWQASPIKRLLLNPSYIGYRTYLGEKIESPDWFPPILDERTHYMCASKLTSPERGASRPSAVKHLLSCLGLCGVCGGMVKVIHKNSRPRYCCRARNAEGRIVGHVARNKHRVDAYVESVVVASLQKSEAVAAMSSPRESSRLHEILADLDRARAELNDFYNKAGEITAEGLARAEAARVPHIKALEAQARNIQFVPHVRDVVADGPDGVPARWAGLAVAQKRDIISALFEKIEIMPVGGDWAKVPDSESIRLTPRKRGV